MNMLHVLNVLRELHALLYETYNFNHIIKCIMLLLMLSIFPYLEHFI